MNDKKWFRLYLALALVILTCIIAMAVVHYLRYGGQGKMVLGSRALEDHQYRNINNRKGPGFEEL